MEGGKGLASLAVLLLAANIVAQNLSRTNVDVFGENMPENINVYDVVQNLVSQLTKRLRCSSYGLRMSDCTRCLQTDRILELLQIETNQRFLVKEEVVGLSVILLHHILNFPTLCTADPPGCSDYSSCRDGIFHQIKADGPLESLETVLRDVKNSLMPIQANECFSADIVLAEVNEISYGDSEEKIGQIITTLMKYVFSGRCIDVGESLTDFLDHIFSMYGDQSSSVIGIHGLKKIMHDLQYNGIHTHDHDDHHTHDHNDHHDHENHNHDTHGRHDHHYHGTEKYELGDTNFEDHDHNHHDHNHFHIEYDGKEKHIYHGQQKLENSTVPQNSKFVHPNIEQKASQNNMKHNIHHGDGHEHNVHENHSHENHSHENHSHDHHDHHHDDHDHHHDDHDHHHDEVNNSFPNSREQLESNPWLSAESKSFNLILKNGSLSNLSPKDDGNGNNISILGKDSFSDLTTDTVHVSHVENESSYFDDNGQNPNFTSATILSNLNDSEVSSSTDAKIAIASALRSELFHQNDNTEAGNGLSFNTENLQRLYSLGRQDMSTPMAALLEKNEDIHQHISLASKCLSVEELMSKFGRMSNNSVNKMEFLQLCPALVQQLVSGVCNKDSVSLKKTVPEASNWELYGYSTLAVIIISLTSLAGVVLLPLLAKQAYYYVMAGCIGLAFSTLTGDALLHLIPQALGLHSHSTDDHTHGEDGHSHDEDVIDPILWRQLGVFFAIYVLYLFEAAVCAFSKKRPHSHNRDGHGHSHIPDAFPKELTLVSVKVKSESNAQLAMSPGQSSLDTEIAEIDNAKNQSTSKALLSAPAFCGLTTVAFFIIVGDSIHNFGDGLAIGASFSSGIRSGLSTSIAVFCHELPHEFGDFVILLSTGMSFSKALLLNFLSALTCLAGLYIGIHIGVNDTARTLIMSVTAGIFLYVALTEMLPELKGTKKGHPVKMLLAKNLGIVIGIVIIVLISIYEHQFNF